MNNTVIFEANESFSVPVSIVDKFLSAPETELRLILFLLRFSNHSFLKEELCEKLAVDENRLKAAFDFWVKKGVLFKLRDKYVLERPRVTSSDAIKYSADRISERIESDKDLQFLYKCAEEAFKAPLTAESASTMLSLVDFLGLKPEVVLLLIQYCADEKKSLRSLTSMGIDWAEKGIDSYEKAEEHLKEIRERNNAVGRIVRLFGLKDRKIVAEEKVLFVKWQEEYGFEKEVINRAYELCIANSGKYQYKYINTVLTNWHEKGYKTLAEIEAEPKNEAKKKTNSRRRRDPKDFDAEIDTTSAEALSWDMIEKDLKEEK